MTIRQIAALTLGVALAAPAALAENEKPDFEKISEGYEKVVTGTEKGMWSVWKRDNDAQLLAEIPKSAEGQWVRFVATIAGGDPQLGVYSIWHSSVGVPAKTVYWKQRGDKLALIEPNLDYRSTGDAESKSALERIYTDRVVLSVPIITTGPNGGHVIDLDKVLLTNADDFFGRFTQQADQSLAQLTNAKVFPNNIEISFELPRADGQLAEIHYSLGMPDKSEGFVPREADRRVGVYYVNYTDRSKHSLRGQVTRYANRWHIEKADTTLKMSPPKKPIVYYIEHTTPIRYRRWVREGILAWNKAFEQIGIVGAIEVRQQDKRSGANMDIDPEDIRYSFVRWTNSSMGFAIGPVHVHPDTGEIYEADIVMDEGFLSSYANQFMQTELASTAMATMHPELAPWLMENPEWDPRVRLASPADRPSVKSLARMLVERPALAETALDEAPPTMRPEVWAQHQQAQGAGTWSCKVQPGLATSVAMVRLAHELGYIPMEDAPDGDASVLDGLPEQFVGPLLRDVVMHEVGHTMGMMHNWKGSAQYAFSDINSEAFKGNTPILGTVMDYAPANIVVEDGKLIQGDYAPIDIGPYDKWVIEWNYTFGDPAEVADRATEPGLGFNAEDGAFGPDPQAKVWDLGENSLDYADAKMEWVRNARAKFLDVAVKDDDTWQRARSVYGQLLGAHFSSISLASNWIGGAYTNKFTKGDNGPDPVRPVEVQRQRRALQFIVDHAFNDEAFGLDPAVLRKLGSDNWYDFGFATAHDWPVHDQVLGVQASVLSMLINPTRLRRVQDNELRTPPGQDALTVPELLQSVRKAIWAIADRKGQTFTDRRPLVSSLQRNLQKEHVERLIDLATGSFWPGASRYDLQALAREELRTTQETLSNLRQRTGIDAYTKAHANDLHDRIAKALEANYARD